MKNLTSLLIFVLIASFVSCKKDKKETVQPPAPTDYATKEVQVILPKPGIDLTTRKPRD